MGDEWFKIWRKEYISICLNDKIVKNKNEILRPPIYLMPYP